MASRRTEFSEFSAHDGVRAARTLTEFNAIHVSNYSLRWMPSQRLELRSHKPRQVGWFSINSLVSSAGIISLECHETTSYWSCVKDTPNGRDGRDKSGSLYRILRNGTAEQNPALRWVPMCDGCLGAAWWSRRVREWRDGLLTPKCAPVLRALNWTLPDQKDA